MSDSMANNVASPRSAREAALERRRALSHTGAASLGKKSSSPAPSRGMKETDKSFSSLQSKVSSQEANPNSRSDTRIRRDQDMSDSMANNGTSPRSAREAALERRRALSHTGAASLGKKSSSPAPSRGMRRGSNPIPVSQSEILSQDTAASMSETRSPDPITAIPIVKSIPAEQAAVMQNTTPDCGCGTPRSVNQVTEQIPTPSPTFVENSSSGVRQLNRQRRNNLSRQGKLATSPSSNGRVSPNGAGKSVPKVLTGLSGREAARARREMLCQLGRGNEAACRPSGRVRPKLPAPVKVEQGTTLSGIPVTGTQVERNVTVTGSESGSCRTITGTEYIGSEQYETLCASVPEPTLSKFSVSRTARGQNVSGTEVIGSAKVTGDEHGFCKTVTGTEYLSADKFESFCATKPFLPPAKVNMAITEAGQNVSGTEVGGSAKVTGDEQGSYRRLTGTQYHQPESSASVYGSGKSIPHKVSVMQTLRDQVLTGTETNPGGNVTGADHGICANVTGTESGGLEQYQACNRRPVPGPEKVDVMRTWHDQPVSGTPVEHSLKVTGDESGACQPITGTEYVGPNQYVEFCDNPVPSPALTSRRSGGMMMTGIQVGPDSKVTGFNRGERAVLSGTPYGGPNPESFDGQLPTTDGNFSIATPARTAQNSSLNRVTGTPYGTNGRRITGPVNLAAGLVSGTPEFRYRDESYTDRSLTAVNPEVPYSRLTGEGREGGFAITGAAAWRRNENITGTEGASTRRNPTLRGGPNGMISGAYQMKDREKAEMPPSRVTGNIEINAASSITYSGGTRG